MRELVSAAIANNAFEGLDLIGWEQAGDVLPTVVGQMVAARGAKESTAWRQPEDLVTLCQATAAEVQAYSPPVVVRGAGLIMRRSPLLLGDDAVASVKACSLRLFHELGRKLHDIRRGRIDLLDQCVGLGTGHWPYVQALSLGIGKEFRVLQGRFESIA
jgi:hypothetical protein